MPKIIKDVENTISDCAFELFTKLSYAEVDMKMISKKSGVAVGTLYNYYKNKKQLYISIIMNSWENTFRKFDEIARLNVSSKEKLIRFIRTLYEDMEARKMIGRELVNPSAPELKNNKEIDFLKIELLSRIKNVFSNLEKVEILKGISNIDFRLTESLLSSIFMMIEVHPYDKENNINYLIKFISLSIK